MSEVKQKKRSRKRKRRVKEKKVRTELGYTVYYVCPRCGREYHDPRDAENCPCEEYADIIEQNERLRRKLAYTKAILDKVQSSGQNPQIQIMKPEVFAEAPEIIDLHKTVEKHVNRTGNKIEKALIKARTVSIPSWIALAITSIILSLIFLMVSSHILVATFVSVPFLIIAGICLFFAVSDMLFPQAPAYVEERFELEVERPYGRVKLYCIGDPRPFVRR